MDELKKALGLAADADDAAVLAAVEALKAELSAEKEKALDAEAAAFADEHAEKVENKAILANAYKKDPELAKALILNCKAPAAPVQAVSPVVCNSAAAARPDMRTERSVSEIVRGLSPAEANAALLKAGL